LAELKSSERRKIGFLERGWLLICSIYCRCHLTAWLSLYGSFNVSTLPDLYKVALFGGLLDLIRWPINGGRALGEQGLISQSIDRITLEREVSAYNAGRFRFAKIVWCGVWTGYLLLLTISLFIFPTANISRVLSSLSDFYNFLYPWSRLLREQVPDLVKHGFAERAIIVANAYAFCLTMYVFIVVSAAFRDPVRWARICAMQIVLGLSFKERFLYRSADNVKWALKAAFSGALLSLLLLFSASYGLVIHWPGSEIHNSWRPQSSNLFFFILETIFLVAAIFQYLVHRALWSHVLCRRVLNQSSTSLQSLASGR